MKLRTEALVAVPILAAAIVHWPALKSDFRPDDLLMFYQAANLTWLEFVFTTHGGHLLMARNAIFLAFSSIFGLDPLPYFVAALLTHLVNVALVFRLAKTLTGSYPVAALMACLWGMAPVHQATINWVAIYGSIVAATALLWVLGDLAQLAAERRVVTTAVLLRWGVLLVAAATNMGSGLAAALAFAPICWLVLPRECGRTRVVICMTGLALAIVVLYAWSRPPSIFEIAGIGLSPSGALGVLKLFINLSTYGIAALVLGPWGTFGDEGVPVGPLAGAEPRALLYVMWTVALAWTGTLTWLWLRAESQLRRQLLAFALLGLAIYGLTALARAPLAMLLSLGVETVDLAPRYQYLPTLGYVGCLILMFVEMSRTVARSGSRPSLPRWAAPSSVVLSAALLVYPYAEATPHLDMKVTVETRQLFDQEWAQLQGELLQAPASSAGEVLIDNRPFPPMGVLQGLLGQELFPGLAAFVVFMEHNGHMDARNVKIIESDTRLVAALRARPNTRISSLLVTPDEARIFRANASVSREP